MKPQLEELLAELERFGSANDRATGDRSRRMLNITRETGQFLAVIIRMINASRILEIGTSNGYSTLWLAEAAQATGGRVTSVDISADKLALARENISRSDLAPIITLLHDDGGHVLGRSGPGSYDLVFLDAERAHYTGYWPDLKRVLRPGGLLVVDNATTHPDELVALFAVIEAEKGFTTCLLPLGNGQFLAVKEPPG